MLALIHIHIQWIAGIIFIILYCVTILGLVLVIITENDTLGDRIAACPRYRAPVLLHLRAG